MTIVLLIIVSVAACALCVAWLIERTRTSDLTAKLDYAKQRMMPEDQYREMQSKLQAMRDDLARELEKERQKAALSSSAIAAQVQTRKRELASIDADIARAEQNRDLMELGFRRRQFTHEDPASYQRAIEQVEERQAAMLKRGEAARCTIDWRIEGSAKKGEAMIGKLMKLAIRAFNGDADAAIAKARWNNLDAMAARIRKSEETIEKTLDKWGIIIVDEYRNLKLKELQLTFEQAELQQRIKEEQRALREQQREEERARREAEAAEREAERDERRLATALERAKREMGEAHTADMSKYVARIQELEGQMVAAAEKRQRAISMAQLTKMGNVYIVSNVGSFGDQVLKIGMTRRMDPMDRVWELSDASVPFDFDVHGMIKTDDAPALEAMLHRRFADRRINLVNLRKEFFRVTIHDVQEVVAEIGLDVRLSLAAEAREHNETLSLRAPQN